MVRLKILFIISMFCVLTSCAVKAPLRVKENFSFCYDSTINYSSSNLSFNGYYVKASSFERIHYDWKTGNIIDVTKDTLYSNILFFRDGIFVSGFQQLVCNDCHNLEDKIRYLKRLENCNQVGADLFYNSFMWGVYKIEGDTIKTQSVNHQSWPNPYWYLVETWYIITKENTIVPIYSKDLIENKEISSKVKDNVHFKFIETNLKLPSDTWLKNQKWFWCDEKEWKAYRDSIK